MADPLITRRISQLDPGADFEPTDMFVYQPAGDDVPARRQTLMGLFQFMEENSIGAEAAEIALQAKQETLEAAAEFNAGLTGFNVRFDTVEEGIQVLTPAIFGGETLWGALDAVLGSTMLSGGKGYIGGVAAGQDGRALFRVTLLRPTRVILAIATRTDDANWTVFYPHAVDLASGYHQIGNFRPQVSAVQYPVFWVADDDALSFEEGGDATFRAFNGAPIGAVATTETFVDKTPSFGWIVEKGVNRRLNELDQTLADDLYGSRQAQGTFPAFGLAEGVLNANTLVISLEAFSASGTFGEFEVASSVQCDVTIGIFDILEPGHFRRAAAIRPYRTRLAVGVSKIPWKPSFAKGQVVGIRTSGAALSFVSSGSTGTFLFHGGDFPGDEAFATAGEINTAAVSFGWTVVTGAAARIAQVEAQLAASGIERAGVGLLGDAEGIGLPFGSDVSALPDCTERLVRARVLNNQVHVPAGDYPVTWLPYRGDGYWGPGRVWLNGRLLPLPTAPQEQGLSLACRSVLAEQIATGSPLLILGSSISSTDAATGRERMWTHIVSDVLNAFVAPGTVPTITLLWSKSAFFGITYSGTVTKGSRGPADDSVILAAGTSMKVSGPLSEVAVWYTRQPGAGSIEIAYEGGSPLISINAAGALAPDQYLAAQTDEDGDGDFTIKAVGNPVEITGLRRIGLRSETAGALRPAEVQCSTHGGWRTHDHTNARIDSALTMAAGPAAGSAAPFVIIETPNNMLFGPAGRVQDYEDDLNRMIDKLEGVATRILLFASARMSAAAWQGDFEAGTTFDDFDAVINRVARLRKVEILRLSDVEIYERGLDRTDGLHPWDDGQEYYARRALAKLASL